MSINWTHCSTTNGAARNTFTRDAKQTTECSLTRVQKPTSFARLVLIRESREETLHTFILFESCRILPGASDSRRVNPASYPSAVAAREETLSRDASYRKYVRRVLLATRRRTEPRSFQYITAVNYRFVFRFRERLSARIQVVRYNINAGE